MQHAILIVHYVQKVANRHFLTTKYLFIFLNCNKYMLAYIKIYRDAIEHIFAKPIAKCLTLLKVMVGQRVIQCAHGGRCKTGSTEEKIPKFSNCFSVE